MTDSREQPVPSETDRRFVERQIRSHVDIAQWQPDPYALAAKPESWRRAFTIAALAQDGVTDVDELAQRLGVSRQEIEDDIRLVPYLDRTIAGLLSVLGWHFDSHT
jgi:hypothetical protein